MLRHTTCHACFCCCCCCWCAQRCTKWNPVLLFAASTAVVQCNTLQQLATSACVFRLNPTANPGALVRVCAPGFLGTNRCKLLRSRCTVKPLIPATARNVFQRLDVSNWWENCIDDFHIPSSCQRRHHQSAPPPPPSVSWPHVLQAFGVGLSLVATFRNCTFAASSLEHLLCRLLWHHFLLSRAKK